MNEQGQPAISTAANRQDEPDDSEPTEERQAELQAAREENVKANKPPYAGVAIGTRGNSSG